VPLNLSHIWTHPGLQGQFRVTACRITTARIYTACHVRTRVSPGLDGFRALPPQQFDDLGRSLRYTGSGRAGRTCLAITTSLPTQSSGGSQSLRRLSLPPWTTCSWLLTPPGDNGHPSPTTPKRSVRSYWPGRRWHSASHAELCPLGASDSGDPFCDRRPAAPRGHHG
jgi:hypothetical protein